MFDEEREQQQEGVEEEAEGTPPEEDDSAAEGTEEAPGQDDFDKDRALGTIRTLRASEKELSKQLKALQRENKQFKRGQQSEVEQLQSDLEEAREKIQDFEKLDLRRQAAVRRSNFIERVGLPNPRLAYASLAEAGLEVEYDDDDRPTNLKEIRKALKTEFPREFGNGSADGGSREERAGSPTSMNDMIRSQAGR